MKILQEAGTVEILASTPNALQLIERAGRTAYQSYKDKEITDESADKFIRMIIKRGHESVLEHASFTAKFEMCSRGQTHEEVRHRLCAFTQESTRYVDESDLYFVMPPHKDSDEVIRMYWSPELMAGTSLPDWLTPKQMILMLESFYRSLKMANWVSQDARQFLPIGTKSEIVHTANFREWRHIFRMRCAKPAHWEIKFTMKKLLNECINRWPAVFDDLQFLLEE